MLGDIIYVSSDKWQFGFQEYKDTNNKYRHYGIDVGNNEVVHFVNYNKEGYLISKVLISSLDDFKGMGILGKCYRTSYEFSKYEIINRALKCVTNNFEKYNPYNNNCEHFVRWCVTGKKYYNDINRYIRIRNNLEKYRELVY